MIDFLPVVMWNDITYELNEESETRELKKGEKIGEVARTLVENVCPGYKIKNGDAGWEAVGTPIYRVQGYSDKYRVFVGTKLFEVKENPKARTVAELYDIRGKVKSITIMDPETEKIVGSFSNDEVNLFCLSRSFYLQRSRGFLN